MEYNELLKSARENLNEVVKVYRFVMGLLVQVKCLAWR